MTAQDSVVPELPKGHPHRPHFGYAHVGGHTFAVHARTIDHLKPLPEDGWWTSFNKRCAIWITKRVGSMNAFWLFTLLAALVAPSCLYAGGYIGKFGFITTFGFELLATLVLSTWLELVLMPAIMVQGNIAAVAADARQAKQFQDLEQVKDWLDENTDGGIKTIIEKLNAIDAKIK
ncbi:MAG: hypothetical protein ABSG46_20305 [Candidatus Binataceae bacterium]|jgi:hypothetical protein